MYTNEAKDNTKVAHLIMYVSNVGEDKIKEALLVCR
jgi:hypothetical protein